MKLHTAIDIEASPEQVWALLTDVERWSEWNPFLTRGSGEVTEGSRLRVTLSPPGRRSVTMKPRVTVVEPGHIFEWLGHVGFPGIFDGRHRFELAPTASGTRLTQGETFTGVLVRLVARSLSGPTAAGFALMNEALKVRAEQVALEV